MQLRTISLRDVIRHVDVAAHTDAYVADGERLVLLSLVGPDSAVKAISAGLLSGWPVRIEHDGAATTYTRLDDVEYTVSSIKLPCGYLHQLVTQDDLLDDGGPFVVVSPGQSLEDAIFQRLQRSFSTPLRPTWTSWVCHQLRQEGAVLEMVTEGLRVVRLFLDERQLDELVTTGMQRKDISL